MKENLFEQQAKAFCAAIKHLAENENNLDNFECYLSYHFDKWLEKFAYSPDSITAEVQMFADMKI